jgi:large conductance mechanosensitive channel
MLKEFKAFILRGNLVEIAVAFIMALAFAAVVASFVGDIVTPIIAAIFGQPDFGDLKIDIGESAISYGKFLNAVITFLIVGFVMFLIVKAYNQMSGPKAATTRSCPFCRTDIALDATRCPNCTSELQPA